MATKEIYRVDGMMHNPATPGEVLKMAWMEPLGLSVTDLAERIGMSRGALSRIINGRARLTIDVARRLAKAFGTGPGIWLRLQAQRDEWEAGQMPDRDLKKIRTLAWRDAPALPG